jgi:hypothetical protein
VSKRRRPPKRHHRRPHPKPGQPFAESDPDRGLIRIADWPTAARFVGSGGHGDDDAVRVVAALMALTILDRLTHDHAHRAIVEAWPPSTPRPRRRRNHRAHRPGRADA